VVDVLVGDQHALDVGDRAAELAEPALERFLRYVRIDTQSDPDSDAAPSTRKQFDLLNLLAEELRELGLEPHVDEHGVAMATVPATTDRPVPTLGFVAHVDTSPDVSGANVDPQVHREWDGSRIELARGIVLDPEELSELGDHVGHDIVSTDGTTLLGADDKAGVAEIMAAAAYLLAHPELEHGPIALGFTPDEEIGHGTDHFDLQRFGAEAAFTVDGSTAGEVQDETFSALEVVVRIRGVNMHPGFAKDRLVNAIKLAQRFLSRLPDDRSPETTDERQGFVHPTRIEGDAGELTLRFIVRAFDEEELAGHEAMLRGFADEVAAEEPRARLEVTARRQYSNMKQELDRHPHLVAAADEAVRRAGLEPRHALVRGGTDGSVLTAKGLPTPNVFTGGHAGHSEREWICVQDLGAAAATLVHLAQVWAEIRS
jgi:tripeptide aminopeptidase